VSVLCAVVTFDAGRSARAARLRLGAVGQALGLSRRAHPPARLYRDLVRIQGRGGPLWWGERLKLFGRGGGAMPTVRDLAARLELLETVQMGWFHRVADKITLEGDFGPLHLAVRFLDRELQTILALDPQGRWRIVELALRERPLGSEHFWRSRPLEQADVERFADRMPARVSDLHRELRGLLTTLLHPSDALIPVRLYSAEPIERR
jgi:hypothetical protein